MKRICCLIKRFAFVALNQLDHDDSGSSKVSTINSKNVNEIDDPSNTQITVQHSKRASNESDVIIDNNDGATEENNDNINAKQR